MKDILDYKYAYLLGDLLFLFPIWLFLFVRRKDLRREILILSLVTGVASTLLEYFYLRDYWNPLTVTGWPISIEDFLYGFFFAGIAGVIYEELFGKKFAKRNHKIFHWPWLVAFYGAMFLFAAVLVVRYDINSMYASIVTLLCFTLAIIWFRHDLLYDAFFSGLSMGILMLFGFVVFLSIFPDAIHRWWQMGNISGIMLWGIPIEELVCAFSWGMVGGPIYEFLAGLKFKRG